jgi:hypothetical protein
MTGGGSTYRHHMKKTYSVLIGDPLTAYFSSAPSWTRPGTGSLGETSFRRDCPICAWPAHQIYCCTVCHHWLCGTCLGRCMLKAWHRKSWRGILPEGLPHLRLACPPDILLYSLPPLALRHLSGQVHVEGLAQGVLERHPSGGTAPSALGLPTRFTVAHCHHWLCGFTPQRSTHIASTTWRETCSWRSTATSLTSRRRWRNSTSRDGREKR